MSARNSKPVDLNVKGSAIDVQQIKTGHCKIDTHTTCRKEIERLKRELTIEKSNCRKLKSSLSEAKVSHEDSESNHMKDLSSRNEKHKEEVDLLKSGHAKVLSCLNSKHQEEIQLLECKYRNELEKERKKALAAGVKLNEEKEKYENSISSKEEHIEKLKLQVAESLEVNSKERHQQIDELMKELHTVSEEAAYLKDVVQNSNFSKCQKCSFYENKYKELAIELSNRNEHFKALMEVCAKMETQLSQQDDLCMTLASLKDEISRKV